MKTYKQIEEAIVTLRASAAKAFRREHPVGSRAWYWMGDNEIQVEIMEYLSYVIGDLRVKVRGKRGKEYWIYASRVEEFPR